MEEEWYEFAAVVDGTSGSEALNVPTTSNSLDSSGASSNCIVLETLSTPAKAKAPNVIDLDLMIANPTYEESRKRKRYELN
jgi:hypothetical protein